MVVRRLGQAGIALLAMLVVVFCVVRLTGDPLQVLLPVETSQETYDEVAEAFGLNDPLPVQFVQYLREIASGQLGESHRTRTPVVDLIGSRLPYTFSLGTAALMLGAGVALPLGAYAAKRRGGIIDLVARSLAVFWQSVPLFWLGIVLVLFFAVNWNLLPAGGSGTLAHLILPAATLASLVAAGLTRLLRSSLIEVLDSDYIRFARSRGVPERRLLWKHALRNAALPVLTLLGTVAGTVLTGSVVTETVFGWPGLGRLLVESITARDFPVVQGVVLILGGVFILTNLAVDVASLLLNPRLRRPMTNE